MNANPSAEPSENISEGGAETLIRLVLDAGLTIAQAHRTVVAEQGWRGSYKQAARRVAHARAARADAEQAGDVAGRILRLLSSELAAIERKQGPKDLERVQRIAQTLGQIERLSPKGKKKEEPSLLSLMPSPPKERSEGDLRDGAEGAEGLEVVPSEQLR